MTIYDGFSTWKPGKWPAILAIGDSWFWYPKNNLLEALARHPKLKDGYQHMVRLGANGALLSEYVDVDQRPGNSVANCGTAPARSDAVFLGIRRQRRRQRRGRLFTRAQQRGDMREREHCRGMHQRGRHERPHAHAHPGDERRHARSHVGIREAAAAARRAAARIRLPAFRTAGPFTLAGIPFKGPWLAKAMDDRSVPTDLELRKGITRILIERMNTAFQRYAQPATAIYFVDSRGRARLRRRIQEGLGKRTPSDPVGIRPHRGPYVGSRFCARFSRREENLAQVAHRNALLAGSGRNPTSAGAARTGTGSRARRWRP